MQFFSQRYFHSKPKKYIPIHQNFKMKRMYALLFYTYMCIPLPVIFMPGANCTWIQYYGLQPTSAILQGIMQLYKIYIGYYVEYSCIEEINLFACRPHAMLRRMINAWCAWRKHKKCPVIGTLLIFNAAGINYSSLQKGKVAR